jgi:hypothetical protein
MKCIGIIAMLALGLLLGCSAGGLPTSDPTMGTPTDPTTPAQSPSPETPSTPETPTAPPATPTMPNPPVTGIKGCSSDGAFDFHIFGTLSGYEGRLVAAVAIENPDFGATSQVQRRPVEMTTQVQGGSFSIQCPTSLRETYAYPSYALLVDADQDGHCSAGDVGLVMQLYGWDQAVEHDIAANPDWYPQLQPVGELHGGVGMDSNDFCTGYFPGI